MAYLGLLSVNNNTQQFAILHHIEKLHHCHNVLTDCFTSCCTLPQCKTSVKKGQCSPVWNEELSFIEALPALCNTIQIQLKDNASVTDDIIGTYYIDLMSISDTTAGTTGQN